MTRADAVDLILAGRRLAARSGQSFTVNQERLAAVGNFSAEDIAEILQTADRIEDFKYAELLRVNSQSAS